MIKSALLTSDDKLPRSSLFDYRIGNGVSLLVSSERDRCNCRAKSRRCNIFSKLCTHRHAGEAFSDCESQMELKALESYGLCFVDKSRVQFHLSAYSTMRLESSGCGFERQKQQRRSDLMATSSAVKDQNNIFFSSVK